VSITSQVSKVGPFIAASYPQAISTGFPFQQASDLVVLDIGSVSTPIDPAHILALGSDYTVTGGGYDTANNMLVGTITLLAGGANNIQVNDQFVFLRNPSENQVKSLINTGSNTATLIEQMGDKMATLSQQAEEGVSRSLRFEQSEFLDGTLQISARKGYILGFDASGNIQYFLPTAGSATPVATGSSPGIVKPDGSTTLVSGTGVISAPTGTIIQSIAIMRGLGWTTFADKTPITLSGYYASGDGGGGTFYVDKADTTTADNGGTVIVASDGTRLKRLNAGPLDIRCVGAKADWNGSTGTDNQNAIRAAIAQSTEVYIPSGRFMFTGVIDGVDNLHLYGPGELVFNPISPSAYFGIRLFTALPSSLRAIASGAIAKGATSFTAGAGLASDLVVGEWIIIQETDHPISVADDICNIDFVQVKQVVGDVVTVAKPFRTAFSGTHYTYGFRRNPNFLKNVWIDGITITTIANANNPIAIYASNCIDLKWTNLTINSPANVPTSRPLYSYQTKGLTCHNCKVFNGAPEIAATVDLSLLNLHSTNYSNSGSSSESLTVDMGSAYFEIDGLHGVTPDNIGLQALYGVHDGIITNNVISYVMSPSVGLGNGIVLLGTQRVEVTNNTLLGGKFNTSGNVGIVSGDAAMVGANLLSSGNIITDNSVVGFTTKYSISANDYLSDPFDGVRGVTNASAAAAGYVGEVISGSRASGSALALTTGTMGNICSIALTPGDWNVYGVIYFTQGATTVPVYAGGTISNSSSGGVTLNGTGIRVSITQMSPADFGIQPPPQEVNISAGATWYLNAIAGFSVSTMSAYGNIWAVRRR